MEYGKKDGSQTGRKSGGIGRNQTPICRNPTTIMPVDEYILEIPKEDLLTLPPDDTLVWFIPATIAGVKVSAPVVIAGYVAATAFIVSAVAKWKEKIDREKYGLPVQPQLGVEPFIDPETKKHRLRFIITGTYPGRRILLKIGKGTYYGLFDPVVGDRKGDGIIEIDNDLLLQQAKGSKIIDIGLPKITSGDKLLYMYIQEVRPLLGDLRSPITPVTIIVKSIFELEKEEAEEKFEAISAEEAASRAAAGLMSYIKLWIPILSTLPGLPYTPGMWVPFGFIITKKP